MSGKTGQEGIAWPNAMCSCSSTSNEGFVGAEVPVVEPEAALMVSSVSGCVGSPLRRRASSA